MLGVRGCIGKISSPTYPRDKTKIEYTSGGQPSFYELTFGVKSDPNPYSKMVLDYTIGPWSQSHSYKIELDEENEDTMEEKKGNPRKHGRSNGERSVEHPNDKIEGKKIK